MLVYNTEGHVAMFCDTCEKQTRFFETEDALYAYTHFGAPIDSEAGSVSWIPGPSRMEIGGGYQPQAVRSHLRHACSSCKSLIPGLVYNSDLTKPNSHAIIGNIGQPDVQVMREDARLNKDIEALFQTGEPTPDYPHSYPRREPGLSTDKAYEPLWQNEDASRAQEEGTSE
jgi:hypothetical protein